MRPIKLNGSNHNDCDTQNGLALLNQSEIGQWTWAARRRGAVTVVRSVPATRCTVSPAKPTLSTPSAGCTYHHGNSVYNRQNGRYSGSDRPTFGAVATRHVQLQTFLIGQDCSSSADDIEERDSHRNYSEHNTGHYSQAEDIAAAQFRHNKPCNRDPRILLPDMTCPPAEFQVCENACQQEHKKMRGFLLGALLLLDAGQIVFQYKERRAKLVQMASAETTRAILFTFWLLF